MQGVVSGMGGVALVILCVFVCLCWWVDVCLSGGSGFSGECSRKVQERQLNRATSISEHHGHSFFHRPLATTRPHSPCCSAEVAGKDRAMILNLTQNTVNKV